MWAWATTKPHALIFVPIWLMLSVVDLGSDIRRWLQAAVVVLLLVTALMAPLYGAWDGVREAYVGAPDFYPFTHINGFSAWFLAHPLIEPHHEDGVAQAQGRTLLRPEV